MSNLLSFKIVTFMAMFGLAFNSSFAAESSTDISLGKQLVEKNACLACHTIGEQGGLVGPNLNQVTIRRDQQWLLIWLSDPTAVKPGTLMPTFAWQEGEKEAVISYLQQFSTPVNKEEILAEYGDSIKAGEALINAYQCYACHKVAGEDGRMLFPDLTTIKERRTPAWELTWLKDPQAVKPDTFMPNFHLSDKEINAITQYLYQ